MIALLDTVFTLIGALATVVSVFIGVALLLPERTRQRPVPVSVREYPPLRVVPRDDLADRRALRETGGRVA